MSFVDSGKAVILNSRQSLYPCGADPWIVATARAIDDIAHKNLTLLVSVGSPAWEICLHLAGQKRIAMVLMFPSEAGVDPGDSLNHYCGDFQLDKERISGIDITIGPGRDDRRAFQSERDRQIIELADVIYPVSIRPGGNFDKLLSGSIPKTKTVEGKFAVPWRPVKRTCPKAIEPERLTADLDNTFHDYIIHWTRGVHYPWPGETQHDFYNAIVQSADYYPRSALNTLLRILAEMRLRASPKHMRQGVQAVSFSSLPPSQAAALMRWRARYREMSFEPYGIAICQSAARRVGIKKAVYGNREMIAYLEKSEKPYFQSLGTIGEWEKEKEYRHLGDLDLRTLNEHEIRVITRSASEIDKIKAVFDGEISIMEK